MEEWQPLGRTGRIKESVDTNRSRRRCAHCWWRGRAKLGSAVASRLARPAAQGAARAGGEVLGGAAGNVIGSGAEQLGFEGRIDPRELAKQAIIGGALNVPGAAAAARRRPALTPESPIATQPVVARQPEVAPVVPRVEPIRQTMEMPRVARPVTAPTRPMPQPDAPATQEMPVLDTGRRLIERTRQSAEQAISEGRFDDAVNELKANAQALRDVKARARKQPGLRVQLERQISQVGNRIGEVRRMAREAGRVRQGAEDAPTAELPSKSVPLLDQVNNPEGGVPARTESQSGRFGALVRQQAAQAEAAPQARRKDTGTLSPVEYLKRKTGGDGIRVSDRGEAAVLGAKEAGIVGLTNRNSKWTLSDAQVMLDEGGFTTADGRKFTDPSITENDVLEFLGASGKQGRLGTRGIDQSLADEEAAYYARLEEEGDTPTVPPTKELPVEQVSRENTPEIAQSVVAPRVDVREVRSTRQPKATDENISALRAEQEQLGREAYDRRGDFTGDLRDRYNELNSIIREYDNARAPRELAPPPSNQPERFTPPTEEKSARREALQSRTGPMPETLTEGRKVTQEMQVPGGLRPTEAFSSREDARQGYFERFNDDELVAEIRRMEDVQNQATRGRSKLSRAELEANRFDLKTAVEMQKERRRQQEAIGIEPANRIEVRSPGRAPRKIQHTTLGEVVEAENQAGVPKGKLRVVNETTGKLSLIQNPRTRGNREASFVKGPEAAPVAAMESKAPDLVQGMKRLARSASSPVEVSQLRAKFPELSKEAFDSEMARLNEEGKIALHRHDHPASLSEAQRNSMVQIGKDYFTAATFREGKGEVMGMGLGPFQRFMDRGKEKGQQTLFGEAKPKRSRGQIAETAGGVQTLSQLGNPRFVIRNVLQHVAFGKQERAATRVAAALDWAISKGSGKPRQVFAPRGSDLAQYVRNWGKVIKAHKEGQPLPGKPNVDYATADANKLDKAVNKVMAWMNEIPDAANWQTRFEQSLQSIMGKSKDLRAPLDMDGVVDQAMMEANKASLRDENFVSSALLTIKKGLNKISSPVFGTDKFGLGDFIGKYAQTPGAVLKRGLERSPLGLFQVVKEAATPGPFRRRNTLLAFSRVVEGGVAGIGLGAALAAAGVLVGPEEENKTGKGFEREEGVRGYSLNASALRRLLTGETTEMQSGDQLYSIDWAQPWAMNASSGAALWGLYKDGKLGATSGAKATGEAVYNSLAKTLDIIGDQSVLKNLSRYLDKATGETFSAKFFNFMKAIGLDVPSSFVPSLAKQTRQVADPFERDTRPEERGGVGGFAKEAAGRALAQIPGVSTSFPKRPSLLTGEDRKTALGEMSTGGRIAAQFSPSNISTFTPRPVAREISRLNQSGQKVSISFPAPKKGEPTSDLRGRERRFAEKFSQLSGEMIKDLFYKDADNEMKAAAFAGLKRHLADLGKEDFEEKTIEEIVEAAIETVEKRRDKEQN